MRRRLDPQPLAFQESIGQELLAMKDRVRNLIGDNHWGEEGRHKEILLRNALKRVLPSHIGVASGFIVKESHGRIECSTQIDIIIYDSGYPVLFKEGDFIVTTPENVSGVIEVKTNLRSKNTINEATEKAANISTLIGRDIFNGIFSYETELKSEGIKPVFQQALQSRLGSVTNICLGNDFFIHYFSKDELSEVHSSDNSVSSEYYGIYKIDNLAFSYFISNLLDVVCSKSNSEMMNSRHWFLFPLKDGKEPYRIDTISVNSR